MKDTGITNRKGHRYYESLDTDITNRGANILRIVGHIYYESWGTYITNRGNNEGKAIVIEMFQAKFSSTR